MSEKEKRVEARIEKDRAITARTNLAVLARATKEEKS
jgi:hypothetical protein